MYLLKNGQLLTSKGIILADLLIKEGKIAEISDSINSDMAEVIDCSGRYVMAGAIDVHVHFRTPGHEHKEDWTTGSRAAVKGGVTTVLDMPNNDPPIITEAALDEKRKIVAEKSLVNYGFNFGASVDNFDEIKKVFGQKGVAAVKVYMGATTGSLLMDRLDVLEHLLKEGIFVLVHAECNCMMEENKKKYANQQTVDIHSKIRSPEVAFKAMKDAVDLAVKTKGRLHICHMSTKLEVDYLRKIRDEYPEASRHITCEVCPHHLAFSTADYSKMNTYLQMNPALHESDDVKALWEGLNDGTVDMIATDHAPHLKSEKEQPYGQAPSGVPGVETVLPFTLNAVHEGKLELKQVPLLLCEKPAQTFRLKNKGYLITGYDGDVTVIDFNYSKEVKNEEQETKCGWSPFDGQNFKGWPVMTFVQGRLVYDQGDFNDLFRGREIESV